METAHAWGPPPRESSLGPGAVHAWRVGLDRPHGDDSRLAPDERDRAGRFRAERDRLRFVASRSALRAILGRYLGRPPDALRFEEGPHGKPELMGSEVAFNLSHSGDVALVAVTRGRRVGIDVERIRPIREFEAIVARFFSGRERAEFAAVPGPLRLDAFFRAWTCKESYIKAIGTGLATPLESFSVAVDPREPARLREVAGRADEPGRWTIRDLAPGAGYAGAVMAEGSDWTLCGFDYPGGGDPSPRAPR